MKEIDMIRTVIVWLTLAAFVLAAAAPHATGTGFH